MFPSPRHKLVCHFHVSASNPRLLELQRLNINSLLHPDNMDSRSKNEAAGGGDLTWLTNLRLLGKLRYPTIVVHVSQCSVMQEFSLPN